MEGLACSPNYPINIPPALKAERPFVPYCTIDDHHMMVSNFVFQAQYQRRVVLQSQDFLGGFYLGQEVGQPGVSRVALGVTRVLPSLLFKLAAAQKEKKYREEK